MGRLWAAFQRLVWLVNVSSAALPLPAAVHGAPQHDSAISSTAAVCCHLNGLQGWEEKRQQAAAVTEAARAALVEEAQDKAVSRRAQRSGLGCVSGMCGAAESWELASCATVLIMTPTAGRAHVCPVPLQEAAAATLQEALGELQALEQEAEQVAAAAQAVPADARLEHEQAAGRLIASAVDAEERGSKAANQRFLAQSMCLAALSGGAEPAALALWQEEKAAAERQLHDAVHAVHLVLRRLHDGNQPPPLNNFGSDSDDDEEAERFRRFMAQANRREAGGGMGQLDLERQLEQQARLFMEQQGVAEGLLPQLLQWEDAPGAAGEEEEEEEEEGPPPVAGV